MLVKEYTINFTQLLRYVVEIMSDIRANMSKFLTGMSKFIIKEFIITMLIREIDISQLMTRA